MWNGSQSVFRIATCSGGAKQRSRSLSGNQLRTSRRKAVDGTARFAHISSGRQLTLDIKKLAPTAKAALPVSKPSLCNPTNNDAAKEKAKITQCTSLGVAANLEIKELLAGIVLWNGGTNANFNHDILIILLHYHNVVL